MKSIIKAALFLFIGSTSMVSCKPDKEPVEPTPTVKKGEVGIEITNYVGKDELKLDSTVHDLGNSQSIMITKFNYYISNVKVRKADGSLFAEEESYHLVTADKLSSSHFHLEDVPAGTYTSISFLIGVDSARNVDGAQTGALDPANNMFWTWKTGYIMAKIEGFSPQSGAPDQSLTYHIGGFTGDNKGIREVTLTFATPLVVEDAKESTIELKADAGKWFAPNTINFSSDFQVMSVNAVSKKIADNYANMFSLAQ